VFLYEAMEESKGQARLSLSSKDCETGLTSRWKFVSHSLLGSQICHD